MFSSVWPLQLLSTPLHTSGEGPTAPLQTVEPVWPIVVPALHRPVQLATSAPGQRSPQATPTSVAFSSVWPLQLSSRPLQISGIGPTTCVHVKPLGPGPDIAPHCHAAVQAPVVLTDGALHV